MFDALRSRVRALLPGETVPKQLDRARSLHDAGQHAASIAIWTPLAESGVPRAQASLGACYALGTGVRADPALARHWLERGAEGGNLVAQRNLGLLLRASDPVASAQWFRRAAENGDAISQDQLSSILLDADPAEARDWAQKAAAQGSASAAARLGTMCHDAVGGLREPAEAARWWHVAAKTGDADSAARLGAALHLGQGVLADQVEAMAWLLAASERRSILVRPFIGVVRDRLSAAELEAARDKARRLGWTGQPG